MRNSIFFIFLLFVISFAISSCDNQKSAMEMIKEENKATERFIDKNGFVILKTYPENGVFKEKEFFKTPEGLYLHVIDSGNGTRARYLKDEVLLRYQGQLYFKSDTTKYSSPSADPLTFIYGNAYSFTKYTCSGFAIPLSYVGEEAEISLIVPSSLGTTNDNKSFSPVYYEKLKYTGFY